MRSSKYTEKSSLSTINKQDTMIDTFNIKIDSICFERTNVALNMYGNEPDSLYNSMDFSCKLVAPIAADSILQLIRNDIIMRNFIMSDTLSCYSFEEGIKHYYSEWIYGSYAERSPQPCHYIHKEDSYINVVDTVLYFNKTVYCQKGRYNAGTSKSHTMCYNLKTGDII